MSGKWQKEYSEFKEYIARNPKIKIGIGVIAIPGDVRPEFYRLFDTVRVAFLKEKYQTLLDEATILNSNYTEVAQGVIKSLGLSSIKIPADLNWFLSDPVNGLIRSLFDPLFNLLKRKIDVDAFEYEASRNVESSFRQLFRSGYEKWVVLSLVNLLAPDRVLAVSTEDMIPDGRIGDNGDMGERFAGSPRYVTGPREESVPSPEEVEILSLEHDGKAAFPFVVPDFIVHSAQLDCYLSIRTGLTDAQWMARQVTGKREWHRLRKAGEQYEPMVYCPDLVIYVDDQPEDIALVADFSRFCRPDIIVECMEQADWYQQSGLEGVKSNHDFLKPRLGTYVVSRETVPDQISEELVLQQKTELGDETGGKGASISIFTVGFDQSRLTPIIRALMNIRSKS